MYAFLVSPKRATYHAHLIFLDLIVLIGTLAILAGNFRIFLQSLQTNAGIVPQAMITSFRIFSNSSIILPLNAL
jgi:hypothetical protein